MKWTILVMASLLVAGCAQPATFVEGIPDDSEGAQEAPVADEASGNQTSGDGAGDPPAAGGSGSGPSGNQTGTGNGPDQNGTQGNSTEEGNKTHQPFEPEEGEGSCNTLALVTPLNADPTGLVLGWDLLELDMALIADPSFVHAHPDDWKELLQDLVDDANVHYEAQMGLRLNASIIDRFPDGTMEPGVHDGQQFLISRGYMEANYPDADVDMVAAILGSDYDGTTAGRVDCVHGASDREWSYLWSEYTDNRTTLDFLVVGFFEDMPLKIFMHETAHLLAAHHHYTQCGSTMGGYGAQDSLAVCGTMINDIGLASYTFSATNRLIMRSFVEELGIGEPV